MSIAILSSKKPSPYDVGATELDRARKAMKQLNELKVNKDTYKRADASKDKLNFNWWTGDDAHREKIEKQTKLEKDISKQLFSIAAANVRNPDAVSPEVMKEARQLEDQLDQRLIQDYQKANDAGVEPYGQDAYNARSDHYQLDRALNDIKPDAIPLSKTSSFLDQVTRLHGKIDDARWAFESSGTSAERSEARKDVEKYFREISKKHELSHAQSGGLVEAGIATPKISALPEGDPLKTAYVKQNKDLANVDRIVRDSMKDYDAVTGRS